MEAPSRSRTPQWLVALGAALLAVGTFWGLAKAPAEVFMGDVQRIMYVRIGEAPRRIHVDIAESDGPPGGIGEPGVPPVAPAIANAVFALTGRRILELPLTPRLVA